MITFIIIYHLFTLWIPLENQYERDIPIQNNPNSISEISERFLHYMNIGATHSTWTIKETYSFKI